MSRNPRSTTPCRPGKLVSSSIQTGIGCGGTITSFSQSSCARPMKSMVKSTIPKRGPPPMLPKKIDYKKPQMTKAMVQRLKHTQKFQDELERKERERTQPTIMRRSRRTTTPIRNDAHIDQERRPITAEDRGRPCLGQSRDQPQSSDNAADSNPGPVTQSCPASCSPTPGQSRTHLPSPICPSRGPTTPPPVPQRTRNLAKSMNADIVQAEPLQRGPVDNLIIPPGAINSERTTIVSIPQPDGCAPLTSSTPSQCQANQTPNRSVQAISETLDEQDAVESAVVNSKLQDLQLARRDFVMAVASVGGTAISLQDENFSNITQISEVTPPQLVTPAQSNPRLIRVPSLEDPYLCVQYGLHHPVVEAAREYMRSRQTERVIDENFARIACQPAVEDIGQDYLEGCGLISTGMNDDDICVPTEQYTRIPRRSEAYRYDPMEIDQLEKFFDLQNYPPPSPTSPSPPPTGLPSGRKCLHPDLWELDDPWYREPSEPDLIDWRSF